MPVRAGNVLLPSENGNNANLPNLGLQPSYPAQPAPADTVSKATPDTPPVVASTAPQKPIAKPAATTSKPVSEGEAYNLTVALAPPAALTGSDIVTISTQMGIPIDRVASQCRIGINGGLTTDSGMAQVESNQATSVAVTYHGTVTNALLGIYAACTTAPKPVSYVYIQKIAGAYQLPLATALCAPAKPFAGTVKELTISHKGTGMDMCVYR